VQPAIDVQKQIREPSGTRQRGQSMRDTAILSEDIPQCFPKAVSLVRRIVTFPPFLRQSLYRRLHQADACSALCLLKRIHALIAMAAGMGVLEGPPARRNIAAV
jgi:hypothetical protein